jgi:hypothetical protein
MNELLCSTEKLVSKSNDRESYRLWFEFLKRAIDDPVVTVQLSTYKSWGKVQEMSFDTWWKKIGSSITSLDQQTYVERVTAIPKNSSDLFFRIPNSITTTQAVNQLRAMLTDLGHKSESIKSTLIIREGSEIRHHAVRAYLVTYDANKFLLGKSNRGRVKGKDLLQLVRDQYAQRMVQYIGSVHRGSQVDSMPSALYGSRGVTKAVDPNTDAQAIATVQRYLKKANEIIHHVANGRFPD